MIIVRGDGAAVVWRSWAKCAPIDYPGFAEAADGTRRTSSERGNNQSSSAFYAENGAVELGEAATPTLPE
jgi:hypothetical protein